MSATSLETPGLSARAAVGVKKPQPGDPPQLLAPRLYRTDLQILESLDISSCRDEFTALLDEFLADHNRAHFKWGPEIASADYAPIIEEFYEFLHRSAIGEFSGCLLYSEVTRNLTDPTLKKLYQCMSRDEGRHSSFLNYVMRHMGRKFDLGALPNVQGLQYMHPKWIFVTTYLSELVGFYRYQNISDHLKRHPEFGFHPIFQYFDNWCKDERRHSVFFALMMRSQPQFLRGPRNQFAIKFFTLAVYVTMYLRDCESRIYSKLGIDWELYDRKVIDETERAARGVWGLAIRTDSPFFLARLRDMRENNFANKRGRKATGLAKVGATIMRYVRYADNVRQYARLMLQRHDHVEPLPRAEWTKTCVDPEAREISLAGAVPVMSRAASG